MKMGLYAFKDIKIGFMKPWTEHNHETARRLYFKAIEDEQQNIINQYPSDIELWTLGTYDDKTGQIHSEPEFMEKYEKKESKK